MVTLHRIGGTNVFAASPPQRSRTGIVSRRAGNRIDLDASLLRDSSFAVWGDVSGRSDNEIKALAARLTRAESNLRPGIGAIFFGSVDDEAGSNGQVQFQSAAPHGLTADGKLLVGSTQLSARYSIDIGKAPGPRNPSVALDGVRLQIRCPNPEYTTRFVKGSAPERPAVLSSGLAMDLSGADEGTVRFDFDVRDAQTLTDLSAGLRADYIGQAGPTQQPFPFAFPTFGPHARGGLPPEPVRLLARIDPINPADGERSYLEFSSGDGDALVETFLTTNYGEPVVLRVPDARKAAAAGLPPPRLLFAQQGSPGGTFEPDLSLLPDGAFEITGAAAAGGGTRKSFGIMCGLSEREYAQVSPGDLLVFRSGCPAFGGSLPQDRTPDQPVDPQFSDHTVTSWLAVFAADGQAMTSIVSEDPDYSLFEPVGDAALARLADASIPLDHAPAILVPKEQGKRAGGIDEVARNAVPIYPWRGVAMDDPAQLKDIEARSLTPARRERLVPGNPPRGTEKTRLGGDPARLTPLGLEMVVGQDGRVKELLLASASEETEKGPVTLELRLTDIHPLLSDALLRTNLFIVCDSLVYRPANAPPVTLGKLKSRIAIAGWTFDVDLPQGQSLVESDGPVLIIKGIKGTLTQLLSMPDAWSKPEIFSKLTPEALADRVRHLHRRRPTRGNDPEEQAAYDTAFRKIDGIFGTGEGADWTGVLVYNLKLVPAELPDAITGLLAGAAKELQKLRVHSLGVDVRRPQPGQPLPSGSPLFATIAYAAANEDTPDTPDAEGFAVKLSRMVVSFDNGEVRAFSAKTLLTLKKLFEGDATEDRAPPSALPFVKILGTYERRLEAGRYIGVYNFEADLAANPKVLKLPARGLIDSVSISGATFTTTRVIRGDKGKKVEARFSLDGDIRFNNWPARVPVITAGTGFRFSGLGIDLGFDIDFKGNASFPPRLGFAPGGMSIDFGNLPKLGSLLGKLPFKFRTFEFWPKGIDLPKLGFTRLRAGREDDENDSNNFKFGFTFDLSLGSLGALAQKFKDFKLSLLLGFGYDGAFPKFALGFKFAGSGGGGLDIAIGNILGIRAESYDVGQQGNLFYFYATGAQLLIAGNKLPDPEQGKLNLFIFMDPGARMLPALPPPQDADVPALPPARGRKTKAQRAVPELVSEAAETESLGPSLPNIGWFAVVTRDKPAESDGLIAVKVIALGQRVNPFVTPPAANTTKAFVEAIQNALGTLPKSVRDALEKRPPDISTVTRELVGSRISYAPEAGWTFGLSARVAEVVAVDFLIHDPKLYGARIALGPENNPFFDLDVLYRKLSEDLGVYSVTFVPPDSIRRIGVGPAEIILPAIGLEIFTDGGFHANLGYPYNRDFSRSATVEIFPFTGGGGIRAGWFKGGGSTLVPKPKIARYSYNPVIEIGYGVRVGLGKSFERGAFRAGLSLTIYSYVQGAYGKRKDSTPTLPHHADAPAPEFWALQGTWGILGEIYGSVDFGIVKARVDIRLYAETGVALRTHDRILLHFEAGVSVRVRVVIASFRIFRKKIVIYATFRFETTIRYETTIGKRHSRFDQMYCDTPQHRLLERSAAEWRVLSDDEERRWLETPIAWTAPPLAALDLAAKLPLDLWFLPDVTAAPQPPNGDFGPDLVFRLFLERELQGDQAADSSYDRFARLLILWTFWCGLRDLRADPGTADHPIGWTVDSERLELLLRKITGPDARDASMRLPQYSDLARLFAAALAAKITVPPGSDSGPTEERTAITFPCPPELGLVRYHAAGEVVTQLDALDFVTPALEDEIEKNFSKLRAIWETEKGARVSAAAPAAKPMAAVVFEEFFGFLVRGLAQASADVVPPSSEASMAEVLSRVRHSKAPGSPERFRARETGAAASRFFNHGLALAKPSDALWQTVRDKVPVSLRQLVESNKIEALGLYRFASLQLPLLLEGAGAEPVTAAGLRLGGRAWFTLAAEVARLDMETGDDRVRQFAEAAKKLKDFANAVDYRASVKRVVGERRVRGAASFTRNLKNAGGVQTATLFGIPFDGERRNPWPAPKLCLRDLDDDSEIELAHNLAAAVDVRLRKVPSANAGLEAGRQIFEIIGTREEQRRLLDTFYKPDPGFNAPEGAPTVTAVELFFRPDKEKAGEFRAVGGAPVVVQTNLSVEPRPEGLARSGRQSFSAGLDTPSMLVELIRRASIINSGGYWLVVDEGALPEDLADEFTLLLVATVQPHKNSDPLLGVNTLKAPYGQNHDAATTQLAQFSADPRRKVAVVETDRLLEALPRPGMIPLQISVDNPAFAFVLPDDPSRTPRTFTDVVEHIKSVAGLDTAAADELLDLSGGPLAHLTQQYNLLEVLIARDSKGDFKPLSASDILPIGDTKPADALGESEPRRLNYEVALQLHRFLAASGADENPYDVVGKRLHLKFRLRDIHGNSLPGPARDGRGGEITGEMPVHYYDGLVSLADLPGFSISYRPAAGGLSISLTYVPAGLEKLFDADPSRPQGEELERLKTAREAAIVAYTNALRQINDSKLKAELHTTPAGTGHATPGYDPAPSLPLPIQSLNPLRSFLRDVLRYLDAGGAVPAATLQAQIAKPAGAAFIELAAELVISRPKELVSPLLDGVENAAQTRHKVPAAYMLATGTTRPAEMKRFAEQLQTHLLPKYVAATGTPGDARDTGETLWMIRDDMLPQKTAAKQRPLFVGVPPLRNGPVTVDLQHNVFVKDQGTQPFSTALSDVDADAFGQIALERIEQLSASSSVKRLSSGAAGRELLDEALLTKEVLSDRIAATAYPILERQTGQWSKGDTAAAVQAALQSRLMGRLTAAYEIDTLLCYRPAWKGNGIGDPKDPARRPLLYGRLPVTPEPAHQSEPTTLSPVALPLPTAADSSLLIFYDSKDEHQVHGANVGQYEITHVQRLANPGTDELLKLPVYERYRSTQWLRLLVPVSVDQFERRIEIPVVRRQLPVRPRIVSHGFRQSTANVPTDDGFTRARRWAYEFEWSWLGSPSDRLYPTIRYNDGGNTVGRTRNSAGDLAVELMRFVLSTNSMWEELMRGPPYDKRVLDHAAAALRKLRSSVPVAAKTVRGSLSDRLKVSPDATGTNWQVTWEQNATDAHFLESTAVSANKGAVRIGRMDVFRVSQARVELDLYRNREFGTEPGNPQFVYHFGGIMAGEAVTPRLARAAILESPLKAGTAQEHVKALLAALFRNSSGSFRFDVEVAFRPETLPVQLQPIGGWPGVPVLSQLELRSDDASHIQSLADAVAGWLKQQAAPRKGHLRFKLTAYRDNQAKDEPILQLTELRIPLSRVSGG